LYLFLPLDSLGWDWLVCLNKVVKTTFAEYRMALYYRGNLATKGTKDTKIFIADEIIQREQERGFKIEGM
jgi:hypothetical protein